MSDSLVNIIFYLLCFGLVNATYTSCRTLAVSLAEPKPTAEIIILTLIINKMKKVLVANIVSTVKNDGVKSFEHELTELNRHLSEGWKIEKYDIVTSVVSYSFSIIYQLHKD